MPHSYVPPQQRDNAKRMRKEATRAEKVLWQELRGNRLAGFGFRRQVAMGFYIADFVCHAAKLVVEIDGEAHRNITDRDRQRDAWFAKRGYRTLRVHNDDVLSRPDTVLESIRIALVAVPPPRPSPARGEGGAS